MNNVLKVYLPFISLLFSLTSCVQAMEVKHIPMPANMMIVTLNDPYAIGEATWVGISSDSKHKTMIMNLEHNPAPETSHPINDAMIFSYNFNTGAAAFLADTWYPYDYQKESSQPLDSIIPQTVLNKHRQRAMSIDQFHLIAGFVNESADSTPKDQATNGTYFQNGQWHTLPAYPNHQSDVVLSIGTAEDELLLLTNEVVSNIYDNYPIQLNLFSSRDQKKIDVPFPHNSEEAYYLTVARDHEDPYAFYQNICKLYPNDTICTSTTSYADRCQINKDTRVVSCTTVTERGYVMTCPLETTKGTRNLTFIIEDNQIRVKQPFGNDLVYLGRWGNIEGAKTPYFYPWMIGETCDGSILRRYWSTLSVQKDPDNPDVVVSVKSIDQDKIFSFVSKKTGVVISKDYASASQLTKVGDDYHLLIFNSIKNPLYTEELLDVRMSAKEKEELMAIESFKVIK